MALDGKVALITGGAQGIGRGIALRLASDGADIAQVQPLSASRRVVGDQVRHPRLDPGRCHRVRRRRDHRWWHGLSVKFDPITLDVMSSRFNFRQKPTGVFKWFLKTPALLFRAKLGFVFGERFLMITHVGRKSGTTFHTPLEVVVHDTSTAEYIVCSGTGPNADWYRNINAHPVTSVQVKNRIWTPDQRVLDANEASDRFADYERRHPKAASKLLDSMGQSYDGTDADRVRMMQSIPMVAFSESPRGA